MKSIIIYQSIHHHNTEKIAKAMAKVLGAKIAKPSEVKPEEINDYDLIGFGSGIYFGQYHRSLTEFVKKLSPVQNKKAFIFSTSGRPESVFFNLPTKSFKKLLASKGFEIIATFNCRGYDTAYLFLRIFGGLNRGHPNEKDLEKAKIFAQSIKNHF